MKLLEPSLECYDDDESDESESSFSFVRYTFLGSINKQKTSDEILLLFFV
jgi:hypothetical protein